MVSFCFCCFSCSIAFIDFEGRSDGESVKRIISIVKPRQLVSIHHDLRLKFGLVKIPFVRGEHNDEVVSIQNDAWNTYQCVSHICASSLNPWRYLCLYVVIIF